MIVAAHQPQYLPWLGYFDKIAKCDAFVILDRVQYKEREFQNRNKIRTQNGPLWLTVPIISTGLGRQPIGDVLIDTASGWGRKHLLSMKAAYGNAPFFKQHLSFFEDLYGREWQKLSVLNFHIIEYILKEFGIRTPIYFESALEIAGTKTDRLIEICKKLGADTYLSGAGGAGYLEEEKFPAAGMKLMYQAFTHPVYAQQHMAGKNDFISCLSIVDLVFNEGARSREILKI